MWTVDYNNQITIEAAVSQDIINDTAPSIFYLILFDLI